MNTRFFVAWLVAFLLWFAAGWVIEGELLINEWINTVTILRGWDGELARYHFMILPYVLWAGGAVWIHQSSGRYSPWLPRGLELGVLMAIITIIPMRMLNYTTFQMPGAVLVKEVVWFVVADLIIGLAIAWIYRNADRARA